MTRRRKQPAGLSEWTEANIRLPDVSAEPGPIKLWPWQREIADALCDPNIERVSFLKPARCGFSSLIVAAIGYYVVERPSPILCVLPTESDCRGFMIDDVEATFDASPTLTAKIGGPSVATKLRNTITHRLFKGGSLKVVAGKAPRNLRRHTAKILFVDEADAIEQSAEGDPIALAERRTQTFGDRKIIVGGTPVDEATSHVLRCYVESDQRFFEIPCARCGCYFFLEWRHVEWEPDQPETACVRCPHCDGVLTERDKRAMVEQGRWRATAPHIRDHAGFRMNSLVSLLSTMTWPKLAAEFLRVKDDPARLKAFTNTILGEPWKADGDEIDETELASRAEPFDLQNIPPEILSLTVGVDCQDDRFEATLVGHAMNGDSFVLEHRVIWGDISDATTWQDLDALLQSRWPHPNGGGVLSIDCAAIDAGDGGHFDRVMQFANARVGRRILAIKGAAGFGRPAIQMSKTRKGRLWIVGSDAIKAQIFARLARGRSIRFSRTLEAHYFDMVASERRATRMVRGKPVARFERIIGKRAEALDCLVYALAARAALTVNFSERSDAMSRKPAPVPTSPEPSTKPADGAFRSEWMQRQSAQWPGIGR